MSKKAEIISPIAIDLGAKYTGVYFAHYPAGSSIEEIDKEGKVYRLEKDKYTLLMANRTAARHQRRGHDRRQMVKRLFKLIWEKHFGLEWDNDVQQTTSFLFNRRGFSFLTEEYDPEKLSRFPAEAYKELPSELRIEENDKGEYDFDDKIKYWIEGDKVKEIYDAIDHKPKEINTEISSIDSNLRCIKATHKFCDKLLDNKTEKKDSSSENTSLKLPKSVLKEWKEKGILALPDISSDNNFVDIADHLKTKDSETIEKIKSSLNAEEKELKEKKAKLRKDIWCFKKEFNKEQLEEVQADDNESYIKNHLHHLHFAIKKTWDEIKSGGRFRSKYFEEVKEVLENNRPPKGTKKNGDKIGDDYIDRFINQFLDNGKIKIEDLHNVICHLSNFELKPLRGYFNYEKHKEGDDWEEKRLAKSFDGWIMKQWRVGEKDRDKKRGEKGDYQELRRKWQEHKEQKPDTVINFWLETDPFYTIPPYQDINNRRPPRCQSLVLNTKFLNNKKEGYPQWREWLQAIKDLDSTKEYLGDYKEKLKALTSSSGQSYFNHEKKLQHSMRTEDDLDAHVFQFILDRTKDNDPLKLNEIYSYAKKYHQCQSTDEEKKKAKEDLEGIIQNSELSIIKDAERNYKNGSIFKEGTFLHLVNRYYKTRQRARDGRLYIHPEYRFVKGRGYQNTGRYDDVDLLTYCNHKPRQKRYQMLDDFAALLQVSTQDLNNFIEKQKGKASDEKLVDWLEGIEALATNCATAAKEQKERKGYLKLDIQKIYGLIYHRKQSDTPTQKEIKEILKQSRVEDGDKLYRFCERAKKLLKQEIFDAAGILWKDDKQRKENIENLNKNPASAVYMLAQINNIIFKERSGNSNTCAVCSADNAQRMQMITDENRGVSHAKASRLPAIATRVIDGAVMRMARIVGGAIAKDKWEKIENELKDGKKVCIPIITESNQFEFEPSLRELKNKSKEKDKNMPSEADKKANTIISDKESRIKEATSHGICPYAEDSIGDDGEIDHIIPRSSDWGTLNDEANLIYVSKKGNQEVKGETEYSLIDLQPEYKKRTFEKELGGNWNNDAITKWIVDTIDDGESEDFKFGRYYNFVQLNAEEQKAFRHALFLIGHPLRDKVIRAIDNRNRTFVNGTQRYFAEVIANSLYKEAKRIKKHGLLSFDYFGIEAWSHNQAYNINDLRRLYEGEPNSFLQQYKKESGKSQHPYSHLIDAQMAFAIAANKHKKEGSLKLKIDDDIHLEPAADKSTGELLKNIFDPIKITPEKMKVADLERRKVYDIETHHRRLLNDNKRNQIQISYKIHRDSIISERFFSLIKYQDEIKKGFHPNNASLYKEKDFELLKQESFLQKCESRNSSYEVWIVNKRKAQEFLMKSGFHGADKDKQKICKLLDDLSYQTVKESIQSVLHCSSNPKANEKKRIKAMNLSEDEEDILMKSIRKPPETIAAALQAWDIFICEDDFKKGGLTLPFFYEWKKLKSLLEKEKDKDKPLQEFLKSCSMFCAPDNSHHPHKHKKVRKVYSLPIISTIGNIRLSRKTWNGNRIFQTMPDESLAKYSTGRPHTILSRNSVPKGYYKGHPKKWDVMPRDWIDVTDKIESNDSITKAKIIYQDAGRCRVKLTVNEVKHLSIPQDKDEWEGKIILYDGIQESTQDQKNHYCQRTEFKWFDEPFKAIDPGRKIEVSKQGENIWSIEFTVRQSTRIKELLTENS